MSPINKPPLFLIPAVKVWTRPIRKLDRIYGEIATQMQSVLDNKQHYFSCFHSAKESSPCTLLELLKECGSPCKWGISVPADDDGELRALLLTTYRMVNKICIPASWKKLSQSERAFVKSNLTIIWNLYVSATDYKRSFASAFPFAHDKEVGAKLCSATHQAISSAIGKLSLVSARLSSLESEIGQRHVKNLYEPFNRLN